MKKTIIALLLVVALAVTLAVPALAEGAPTLYHCTCGAKVFASAEETTPSIKNGTCTAGCLQTKNLAWLPLSENLSGGTTPAKGNFYVDQESITLTAPAYPQILRIDLNGNTLTRNTNRPFHLSGANAQHLLITDTSANKDGVLKNTAWTGGNGAVVAVDNGVCIMLAGTIQGAASASGNLVGGAVALNKGKEVYDGAKFYMYGGTITGGHAHSGGNVAVMDASGEFYMYGGVIENGVTPGTAQQHAGNVRVAAGKFVMSGGTIRDGVANGKDVASPARGGNIMATGAGTTVTISGTAQILGGTAHDAAANSIFINTGATLNVSGGRIEKDILIRKDEGKEGFAVVTGGQFDTTDMSAYFKLSSNMTLVGDLGVAGETLTLTEDTYIDLNGHNILSNIDTGAFTLYLSDSATADYDVKDGKYGKVTGTITGNVARDHVVKNQRYLVVKTADGYSAHRVYLAVISSIISGSTNGGVAYKTVLKCDEVVAGLISDYGVVVNTETISHIAAGETCTIGAWDGSNMNEKVSKAVEILKANEAGNAAAAEAAISVNAYITLNDETAGNVNSAVKQRSMQEMIVKAVENWGSLTAEQQATLKAIYNAFNNGAYMDDKNKWPNVADKLK